MPTGGALAQGRTAPSKSSVGPAAASCRSSARPSPLPRPEPVPGQILSSAGSRRRARRGGKGPESCHLLWGAAAGEDGCGAGERDGVGGRRGGKGNAVQSPSSVGGGAWGRQEFRGTPRPLGHRTRSVAEATGRKRWPPPPPVRPQPLPTCLPVAFSGTASCSSLLCLLRGGLVSLARRTDGSRVTGPSPPLGRRGRALGSHARARPRRPWRPIAGPPGHAAGPGPGRRRRESCRRLGWREGRGQGPQVSAGGPTGPGRPLPPPARTPSPSPHRRPHLGRDQGAAWGPRNCRGRSQAAGESKRVRGPAAGLCARGHGGREAAPATEEEGKRGERPRRRRRRRRGDAQGASGGRKVCRWQGWRGRGRVRAGRGGWPCREAEARGRGAKRASSGAG